MTSSSLSTLRAWWICLLASLLVYGLPVIAGSSWFTTPGFPHRTDGTRLPALSTGYDTFSFPHFDLAYREMAQQAIARGDLPLWNPNSWLGLPVPAQYQNQVFSPLEWMDLLGGNRWWNLTLLLRIALGGFGTFLFVRRFTGDPLTGLMAGLIYQLSGYFAGFQSVSAFMNAAVILPWLFLAVDHAFSSRNFLSTVSLAGGATGLAAVSGQPQIALLNFSAVLIFSLFALLCAPGTASRLRGCAALLLGTLVALAAASPQLAAFHEAMKDGYTIHTPGTYSGGGTTALNTLLPFSPLLLGPMMSPWLGSLFPGQVNHEGLPILLGATLTLGLSLGVLYFLWPGVAVSKRVRLYLACFLLIIAGVSTAVVVNTFGWGNLWSWPIINQINLPRYSAPLLALLATIVGALGFRAIGSAPRWHLPAALVIVICALFLLLRMAWPVLITPGLATNAPLRSLSLVLAGASTIGSLLVALAIMAWRGRRDPDSVLIACGLLVIAELSLCVRYGFEVQWEYWRLLPWFATLVAAGAWAWQFRRTALTAMAIGSVALMTLCLLAPRFLEKSRDPFIEHDSRVQFLQKALSRDSGGGRVLTSQWVMIPNTLAAFGVAQINALNPVQPGLASKWFRTALAGRDLNYTLPVSWYGMVDAPDWPGWRDYADGRLLYNFMGIRYLVESSRQELSNLKLPDMRVALDTRQYRILEDLRAWPRAFLVNGGIVTSGPGTTGQAVALAARTKDHFGSFAVTAPEETVGLLNASHELPVIAAVSTIKIEPNMVRITTSHPTPALLVLTDVHYPGWQVWVDGVEHPVLTVNGLVRGVVLSAGAHAIEFRYRPVWLKPTLSLAILGWLVVLTAGGLAVSRPISGQASTGQVAEKT